MKGKNALLMTGVSLLMAMILLAPAMAQEKKPEHPAGEHPAAKGQPKETMAEFFKKERENLCAELKLSPEKGKEFLAVGDKYDQKRKDIIEQIKKNEADLKAAMAASPTDEAKVKGLVDEAISNQERLFDTFREQRKEEMALLTPMQQGKYLLVLMKWHRTKYERMKK